MPLISFVTVAGRCFVAFCHALAQALTAGTASTSQQAMTTGTRCATTAT
jgi:hypothetical protein